MMQVTFTRDDGCCNKTMWRRGQVWPNEGCVMHKNCKSHSGLARLTSEIARILGIGDVMSAFNLLPRLLMNKRKNFINRHTTDRDANIRQFYGEILF